MAKKFFSKPKSNQHRPVAQTNFAGFLKLSPQNSTIISDSSVNRLLEFFIKYASKTIWTTAPA